ncbi:MAG: YciI family protein [Rheinheimera sp.]|nr:YciI family protein [Rheinheimera sp.]
MHDYLFLMYHDATDAAAAADDAVWQQYFALLHQSGCFDGGSSIGAGQSFRKNATAASSADRLSGFIRVRAENLAAAQQFLVGNPIYEAGGTVEIRQLPKD